MSDTNNLIITSGDPGGIGAQVIIKALNSFNVPQNWRVWILGDAFYYASLCSEMKQKKRWDCVLKKDKLPNHIAEKIIFVDFGNVARMELGCTGKAYGKAAAEYLEYALDLYYSGMMDSLVTAPICKKSLWLAGFHYAGHTHYLAKKTRIKYLTMSMLSRKLKIFFVTDHIAFSRIIKSLSVQRIIRTIERAQECLNNLSSKNPRMGMCSLNPHSGEEGIFGHEEKVIAEACSYWRNRGLQISSPTAPEICFKKAFNGDFDGVIALYHDQGMIPFKLASLGRGLNVSLGLPFVRVSPEHGTAFDIADKYSADESSMLNALNFAVGRKDFWELEAQRNKGTEE